MSQRNLWWVEQSSHLMSILQCATETNVTTTYIRDEIYKGRLKAEYVNGKQWIIYRTEFEIWRDSSRWRGSQHDRREALKNERKN